ncbi:putative NAD-asparagine ribosyltransferase [Vibrio phage vB_VaS_L1]|nr:putative NAD-asparagine ribosyltransferase [Vibrio phage vB_VaS_L1]
MAETALATTLSHEIALIRFSRSLGRDAQPHIDAIMKALREELLSTDTIPTKKCRDELMALVNELIGVELGGWSEELESELVALAKEEAKFHQAALSNLVGQKISRPTLESITKTAFNTEMVLNGQAYTVDERIKNYNANSVDRIKRIITGGWRDGLTTYEISQQIMGRQNSSVKNQMSRGSYTLAKDVTSHISSTAKTSVGMANQDVVVGEAVVVTLDSRTSPICQRLGSLDGGGKKYYYAKDGFNFPRNPFHWNCRSTMRFLLAPEFEELEEPRTRPSVVDGRAKRVDSNKSWLDLAKENKNLAIESLGEERARLLDGMSSEEFVKLAYDRLGNPITLDQLVAKSKKAASILKK